MEIILSPICSSFTGSLSKHYGYANRAQDLTQITQDQIAFNAQKDQPGGKKTMKKYLWSLEMATYDAAHPQG